MKPKQLNPKNRYVPLEYVYVITENKASFDAFREDVIASWKGAGDLWNKPDSFGMLNICFRYASRPEYLRGVKGFFYVGYGFWNRADVDEWLQVIRSRQVFGDLLPCPKEYLP